VAVSVKGIFMDLVPYGTSSTRRFDERTDSIFRGSYVDTFPQLYYSGNAVT
jgi:hypothetical protein